MVRRSARAKTRRSEDGLYETIPNFKQAYFPARKKYVKEKHTPPSARSKAQQTITQMDPFHAIFHPASDDQEGDLASDLECDEEESEGYVASSVGRKRKRITPGETPTSKTKSKGSARESADGDSNSEKVKGLKTWLQKKPEATTSNPQTPAALMPPPQTPRTFRKREIPSSQSPADSPLSTQNRTPVRVISRSPLKERSINISLKGSTSKKRHWSNKLEVADSLETEDSESPCATPRKPVKLFSEPPQGTTVKDPPQSVSPQPIKKSIDEKEIMESSQPCSPESKHERLSQARIILDSDFEDDEDDDGYEEVSASQAQANSLQKDSTFSINANHQPAPNPTPLPSSRIRPTNTIIQQSTHTTQPPAEHTNPPNPSDPISDTNSQATATHQPSLSSAADPSTQLISDLHRAIQPPTLQSESQFENAWIPYHPSSPPHPSTIPTQILPTPPILTTTTSPQTRPLPTSQATTTDLTQSQLSPQKQPPSSSPSSSSASQPYPSSPPPIPPPLSSPRQGGGRKAVDLWAGYEWNGERLTDSQLLPESLMRDSLGGWEVGDLVEGRLGCSLEELEE